MLVCLTPTLAHSGDHAPAAAPAGVEADDALQMLKDGNARFVAGESTFPNVSAARRCETTEGGQHPIASILSCADSRVPPELLFDAGLGDLFVIRVAGNVAATDEIGTIEYGAGHLGTKLVVVMGHSKCGAVTAVVKHADVGPNIARLVAPIAPAVDEARAANPNAPESRLVNLSIRANVRRAMRDLIEKSDEVRELVAAGKVKVVGAVYDIHNGTVDWIGEHPDQAALLKAEGDAHAEAPHADDGHGAKLAAAKDPHGTAAAGHASTPIKATQDDAHGTPKATPPAHDDSHPTPAPKEKPSAHDAAHAAPAPKAKASADDTHGAPAPKKPAAAHGDAHGAADHAEDATADSHEAGEGEHASVGPTLMQRQGLLLPAAFMAAGSALSGTIVYAMTGRAKAAASRAPAADAHDEAKPPAH